MPDFTEEAMDALEAVVANAPLHVDHAASFEHAREDEVGVVVRVEPRRVDVREEPSHR